MSDLNNNNNNHKHGSLKQTNKPSKLNSAKNSQFRTKEGFKEPKSSTKIENKLDRINRHTQLRQNKINEFVLKKKGLLDSDVLDRSLNGSKIQSQLISQSMTNLTALIDTRTYKNPPKLVALVALNESCNLDLLMQNLQTAILGDSLEKEEKENSKKFNKTSENMWTASIPTNLFKGKERVTFFKTQRDIYCILDICKIADLVIFVTSTKGTDVSNWKKNPDKFSNCIDGFGYEILSMLRAQGLPQHIAMIQDLELIADKHKSDVKKLFTRYLESELKPDKTFCNSNNNSNNNCNTSNIDETKAILRLICSLPPFAVSLDIKKHRSYMLCQHINVLDRPEESKFNTANEELVDLELFGYLRGNTLSINNFMHITGFGDFLISDVETSEDPVPIQSNHPSLNSMNTSINLSNKKPNSRKSSYNKEKDNNNENIQMDSDDKVTKPNKNAQTKIKQIDDKVENEQNLNDLTNNNKPALIGNEEILSKEK